MNIRVDLNTDIADGSEVVFRSPADCSQVTGLVIYHKHGKTEFAFADAHGNNVGDIDHLFAENAVVKVILDVASSMAFVQNADTNAYIERTFVKSVNGQAPDEKGNVEIKVPEGGNGTPGNDGKDGGYYVPTVEQVNEAEVEISFTSRGGENMPQVEPVKLFLPRGADGKKGDKGDKGDQGERGPKGDTGASGPQGEPGAKGEQGIPGEKGEKGDPGIPGNDGAPGADGKDGHTPVKGVDYYTPTDKAEFEALIIDELAKRGQLKPEFANSIEECTDTSKLYVLPDGMIYAYMKTMVPGGEPLFTNAFDTVPVHLNKRWSHSSKALSDANGYFTTDLIPVRADQVIYMNIGNPTVGSGFVWYTNYNRITYYGEDGLYVAGERDSAINKKVVMTHGEDLTTWVVGYYNDATGEASTNGRIASADSIRYMRLVFNLGRLIEGNDSLVLTEDHFKNAGLILSVGNPIAYSEPSEGYAWTSTGRSITPADYEDRIIENERKTASNTERIAELEDRVENGLSEDLTDAEKINLIKLWDKPVYDPSPVTLIADERAKPALSTADRTITAIYSKYRELMARFPRHITETNMGKSASSDTFEAVDILRFDFKEPDGLTNSGYVLYEQKPKLIFMSGVHTEWAGVWGLYYALEEIMTNPDFDDIRRNAHIIVVPCSNPFSLTSQTAIEGWRMSHVNANGVAIHNNFHVDHSTKGNVGEYNYGGPAPCSEPETQYVDGIMADNPDAVAFVSCHNNDYCTEFGTSVVWASSATAHMCNITFRLIDKLSKAWMNKYGQTLVTAIETYKTDALPDGEYRLGRAQLSTSKGTEAKNALKYGIQGVNVEISRMMKVFSGSVDGTSEVMTHGAEVYANLMRTLLATYDHKDKKEYAPNLPWSE